MTESLNSVKPSLNGPNVSQESMQSDTATVEDLYHWLLRLSCLVRMPDHVARALEDTVKVYADRLTAYPASSVHYVLHEWPNMSSWWPTWHDLAERLPSPEPAVPLIAAPIPDDESFAARMTRLKLTLRIAALRLDNWRDLLDGHVRYSDTELLAEIEARERRLGIRPSPVQTTHREL